MTRSTLLLILLFGSSVMQAQETELLRISQQRRIASDLDSGSYIIVNEIAYWSPEETAIIVCDMWDQHWCKSSSKRVNELAPAINNVIRIAREKGVLIVHSPSDVVYYYDNSPQRQLGKKYTDNKLGNLLSSDKLDSEKNAIWPIDQSDGGCDDTTDIRQSQPWTRQHEAIEILEGDAVSDSGTEIGGLFRKRGVRNVILVGVHTNMCIINRPFGLRNMTRLGMNVVLIRDLTDAMYNPAMAPRVSHFTGNRLMFEYIETYISPTIVSADLTGEKQFRFQGDNRP